MPISECITTIDSSGRELLQHGTVAFPIACYHDDFREMDVPWHWHEELEAAILTAGSCTVAAGNEKIELTTGQGFFINRGILHGCWDTRNTGCRFHSLVFHSRLVGGSLDSVFWRNYIDPLTSPSFPEFIPLSPDIPWQKQALDSLEFAWSSVEKSAPGFEFQVRSALSEFVFLLNQNTPASLTGSSRKNLRDAERIKALLSCIHEHFGEELTTRDIADAAMVSESECLRCFRSTIGTTPIQYLKQYRIQQAAKALVTTHASISDIAGHCGFQDMSYFTKSFREIMGVTPSQYRNSSGK